MATETVVSSAAAVEMVEHLTYRQLDYWERGGLIECEVASGRGGSGNPRRWTRAAVVHASVLATLSYEVGINVFDVAEKHGEYIHAAIVEALAQQGRGWLKIPLGEVELRIFLPNLIYPINRDWPKE